MSSSTLQAAWRDSQQAKRERRAELEKRYLAGELSDAQIVEAAEELGISLPQLLEKHSDPRGTRGKIPAGSRDSRNEGRLAKIRAEAGEIQKGKETFLMEIEGRLSPLLQENDSLAREISYRQRVHEELRKSYSGPLLDDLAELRQSIRNWTCEKPI